MIDDRHPERRPPSFRDILEFVGGLYLLWATIAVLLVLLFVLYG